MMRIISLLIVWFSVTAPVLGQYSSIRTRVGYGWYRMNDLRQWQQDRKSDPLPIAPTSAFPAYLNLQIQFVHHSPNRLTGLGFLWDHVSTGGRLSYRDYSGELRSDQWLSAESMGFMYERKIPLTPRWSVVPGIQILSTVTKAKSEEYRRIQSDTYRETTRYQSRGAGIAPELSLRYQRASWMLNAGVGYQMTYAQPLRPIYDSPYSYYPGPSDHSLSGMKAQWDGLRAGITLGKTFGESEADPLIIDESDPRLWYRGGMMPGFYVGTKRLSRPRKILTYIRKQPDELLEKYYERYRSNYSTGIVLAYAGGFLLGWPVGGMIAGGEFSQSTFITGMVLTSVGVLFQELSGGNARKLMRRYNALHP